MIKNYYKCYFCKGKILFNNIKYFLDLLLHNNS